MAELHARAGQRKRPRPESRRRRQSQSAWQEGRDCTRHWWPGRSVFARNVQGKQRSRAGNQKVRSVQFNMASALGESQCVHSTPSLRCFPKVAMETRNCSNVWLTVAFSHPFKGCWVLPLSTPPQNSKECVGQCKKLNKIMCVWCNCPITYY